MPRAGLVVVLLTTILICSDASLALMQTQPAPATAPGTAPAGGETLQVTVTGVQGIVQVRGAEDQPWQPATVGMILGEQAEFRTGPRSAVRFTIPPDQTITLDRLGTVKVLTAIKQGGKVQTNLGMKYGRTRYDIEAAGVEHESTISSPSSTLAVRGTKFSSYDQRPFPAEAVSLSGRVEFRDARKRIFVGSRNGGKAKADVNSSSPAEYAAGTSFVDPGQRLARTDAEQPLIAALLSHGATIDFDMEKGIRVIRGGRPLTDSELIPTLPGTLNFVLRWTQNADLNLGIISPTIAGQQFSTVYPVGGLDLIKSGGQTGFDHRGGPRGGMEIVFWDRTPPDGIYAIGVQHVSGVNTPAKVDVYLGTKQIGITRGDHEIKTAEFTATPIKPGLGIEGIGVGLIRIRDGQAIPVSQIGRKR